MSNQLNWAHWIAGQAGVIPLSLGIPGVAKTVRIAENGFGTVLTGDPPEALADFHSGTIGIVTPCVQVVEQCAYRAGTNCFPAGGQIYISGYVTNCGDFRLTNVTILNSRTASLTV